MRDITELMYAGYNNPETADEKAKLQQQISSDWYRTSVLTANYDTGSKHLPTYFGIISRRISEGWVYKLQLLRIIRRSISEIYGTTIS